MNLNFAEALETLDPNAPFMIANEARPPADHLFATLLPEMPMPSYTVDSAHMTVRATMAGLVGMDSPYPEGGIVELSTFLEKSAKIANRARLTEEAIRRLQDILMRRQIAGNVDNDFVVNEALMFQDKLIIQPHMDTMEWLRGRALVNGTIDWTFGQVNLLVDYGIPAANFLTKRTSTDAWDSTASKFWVDINLLQKQLRYNVRAYFIHTDTFNAVLANEVNNIEVVSRTDMTFTIRKLIGDNERPSPDARNTVTLVLYDKEAEIINASNPGQTTTIPFMPQKKILAVANNMRSGYRVGEGSTDDPVQDMALGYTHVAPTVEGGGQPGRWSRLYTPEGAPYQLVGEGVTNALPVIEVPDKIAVAESEIGGS